MLKKSLLTIAFLATAIIVSGCNAGNNSSEEPEQVDYIVTLELPKQTKEGLTDKAVGFVKIDPHYDTNNLPAEKGKIKWFKKGLGSEIPAFDEGKILEVINTDKDFVVYIANVDDVMFRKYYEKLASAGYEFSDKENSWENLNMQNDKYAVNLRFSQDGPNVTTVRAKLLKPSDVKPTEKAEAAAEQETKTTDKK